MVISALILVLILLLSQPFCEVSLTLFVIAQLYLKATRVPFSLVESKYPYFAMTGTLQAENANRENRRLRFKWQNRRFGMS